MAYRLSNEPTAVTKRRIQTASERRLAAKERFDVAEANLARLLRDAHSNGTTQARLVEIADGTPRSTVHRLVHS